MSDFEWAGDFGLFLVFSDHIWLNEETALPIPARLVCWPDQGLTNWYFDSTLHLRPQAGFEQALGLGTGGCVGAGKWRAIAICIWCELH